MNKRVLYAAFQFLTRIPVPRAVLAEPLDDPEHGAMPLYFPLVGLAIGFILLLIHLLLGSTDYLLQAALLLTLWVALTGALHLDGLADLADGWVGGAGETERTLEIMKGSCCGPMGVAAVALLLLIKFAALRVVIEADAWSALLLIPMIGRAGILAGLRHLPYVRPEGIGAKQSEFLPQEQAGRLLLVAALVVLLFWGWSTLFVLGVVAICFLWFRQALMSRLGGITGDGAGALCEILEAAALVALAMTL